MTDDKPLPATPPTSESPLDDVLREIFQAVDDGDFDRRDALMKAAAEQKAADACDDGQTYTDDDGDGQLTREERLKLPRAILIENLQTTGTKDRMAHARPYARLTKPVPFVLRGNPGEHRTALRKGRPHLHGVIDTLLMDLAPREIVRIRPTILVGPPGCGKTTFARAFCQVLGLPVTVFPAAGVSDGMFGGSSSNWSNSNPAIPSQVLLQHAVANPCLVIDEVEKASQGSHNGSMLDVLLNFLDRGNAAIFRDPSLETVVDCSHINWILTANELRQIPGPLRDRCRIVKVPDPEWKHIGEVSRSILDSIADDRDIDRRWLHDLDGDEIKLIGRYWRGGSLRKLVRIVEAIVDVRDQHLARA